MNWSEQLGRPIEKRRGRLAGRLLVGRLKHRVWLCAIGTSVAAVVLLNAIEAQAAELIMYESAGCPYCHLWHKEIGPSYPKSPQGLRAPLHVRQFHERTAADIVLREPISRTPTFVLVENGTEVGRITGYVGSEFFYVLLDDVLAALPSAEPNDGPPAPVR